MTRPRSTSDSRSPAAARGAPAAPPLPVALSWSGGKDSALALHARLRDPGVRVVQLVSTIVDDTGCLTMHGVPWRLVDAQAAASGLPISYVRVPAMPHNEDYERAMGAELRRLRDAGVRHVAFGDLFLEDIRAYRERLLAPEGMSALYPVWGRDTRQLAADFLDDGFRAVVVCADPARLEAGFCGRDYDAAFLRDLPPGVDPCGENGEFHTFVTAAPGWAAAVPVRRGAVEKRDGFWYCSVE